MKWRGKPIKLFFSSIGLLVFIAACNFKMPQKNGQVTDNEQIHVPPMGWNSYTGYQNSLTEEECYKNINFMATHLLPYGYNTICVDAGWFLTDHYPQGKVVVDDYGRPEVSTRFFPNGLHEVIQYAHSKGLKFGLWLIRGVDRGAVERNLPVKGTEYRMKDIVDTVNVCEWCDWNYGVDMSKPGAQAYYDSMIEKMVEYGVDFIKYDDIVPYPQEIKAVRTALDKQNSNIILSLSPGNEINKSHYKTYTMANMVRITDDIWDKPGSITKSFERWEQMQDYPGSKKNSWLDLDMICFGRLYINCVHDKDRECNFSEEQKRTFMVQRALSASPLFLGGKLYTYDQNTLELITHPQILACNQNGVIGQLVHRSDQIDVWKSEKRGAEAAWIGVFNRSNQTHSFTINESILSDFSDYEFFDCLDGDSQELKSMNFELRPNDVKFLFSKKKS